MRFSGRVLMGTTATVDVYDVAEACRHLPHGDALLMNRSPDELAAMAAALGGPETQYAHLCAGLDVAVVEARDLWYWFHPDQADDSTYRELRAEAGHE